ncbi:hypothetical protein JCM5296_000006 [Sporobolomyces johnsonii]
MRPNPLFHDIGGTYVLVIPCGHFDDGRPCSFDEAVVAWSHELVGHLGAAKTLAYVQRFFWWKSLHQDIVDFCWSCEPCCHGKSTTTRPFGFLHPLDPPPHCWLRVGMDFVVGLPVSLFDGRPVDSILTVTDYLSKMVVLLPLPSTATAVEVTDVFQSGVFRRFGLPSAIVSDHDPKFTGEFWRALNTKVGTSLLMSTAAHPQTDGRAEVTNKSVGQILRIFCEDQPDDWVAKVVACEFALNSAVAASMGLAPFETVYGFLPTAWPSGDWDRSGNLAADGAVEHAYLHALQATDTMIAARVAMVDQENRHRRDDAGVFTVSSKAYLSTASLKFPKGVASKFIPRFIGPYPITAASPFLSTYSLALPPHLCLHNKFHSSKLCPHLPNDYDRFPHCAFSTPPPVLNASDTADTEYEIEKVVTNKVSCWKRLFRVRYLGYSAAEDQWRPEAELRGTAPDALSSYLALKTARTAPGRVAAPARARIAALLSSTQSLLRGGEC